MHFGRKNTLFSYQLEGKCLEKVSEEKDLGIIISNDLKVSKQCTQAYAKANKMLGVIKRTIVYKSTDILLQLYKSLVRPHLEYSISAWSPHYNKDKQLLERIQHRFSRMLPGMKELSYSQRLRKLGLWSLEARRYRSDLIEVYKMLHGKSAAKFSHFFELDESYRTRGHSFKLKKSRFNKDLRQHFFSERIVNIWNALDNDLVCASSLNIFKNGLHLLWKNDRLPMGLL